MEMHAINIPLRLTLIRLIVSPLFLPLGMVYLLPYDNLAINILLALFFVFLSLTDFFDGYLARKYNQETVLGKALDPLADKFLFFSAIIALVALHKIYFFWAILLIGREFFIMGLRILALENSFDIPVSWLGKIKTLFQSFYITTSILNSALLQKPCIVGLSFEQILLVGSLFFSLGSAYFYYQAFSKQFFVSYK